MNVNDYSSNSNLRSLVGNYALDKAHLKIDNFCRVYYGLYKDNVHGLSEPFYELAGFITVSPCGKFIFIHNRLVSEEIQAEVCDAVDKILANKYIA